MKDISEHNLLDDFRISPSWTDRRSLVAYWKWSNDADLRLFQKANIYFYSSYDKDLNSIQIDDHLIDSYTLEGLRSETMYLVCFRVHRRIMQKNTDIATKYESQQNLIKPVINITKYLNHEKVKNIETVPKTRYSKIPQIIKFPEFYSFEMKCSEASTQNLHISAIIGCIVGITLAIVLALLIFVTLKQRRWLILTKCISENTLINQEYSFSKKVHKNQKSSIFRRSYSNRSSCSQEISTLVQFRGYFDDEEDAIAEDDEDSEQDTGGKSSIRSQFGVYLDSTGNKSSNRYGSISSFEPQDDISIGHRGSQRDSRRSKHEQRDGKKTLPNSALLSNVTEGARESQYSCIPFFTDSESNLGETKHVCKKTPGDGREDGDGSETEKAMQRPRNNIANIFSNANQVYPAYKHSLCTSDIRGDTTGCASQAKRITMTEVISRDYLQHVNEGPMNEAFADRLDMKCERRQSIFVPSPAAGILTGDEWRNGAAKNWVHNTAVEYNSELVFDHATSILCTSPTFDSSTSESPMNSHSSSKPLSIQDDPFLPILIGTPNSDNSIYTSSQLVYVEFIETI